MSYWGPVLETCIADDEIITSCITCLPLGWFSWLDVGVLYCDEGVEVPVPPGEKLSAVLEEDAAASGPPWVDCLKVSFNDVVLSPKLSAKFAEFECVSERVIWWVELEEDKKESRLTGWRCRWGAWSRLYHHYWPCQRQYGRTTGYGWSWRPWIACCKTLRTILFVRFLFN
jgi:hypothetical protein